MKAPDFANKLEAQVAGLQGVADMIDERSEERAVPAAIEADLHRLVKVTRRLTRKATYWLNGKRRAKGNGR